MRISELMNTNVISITPEESVSAAARILSRHGVGVLPVCSSGGRIQGLITDRDIVLRCVAADLDPHRTKVGEIMTGRVVTLTPEDDINTAVSAMGHEQIRRLPICQDGKLVGILSVGDLAQHNMLEASEALSDICKNLHER